MMTRSACFLLAFGVLIEACSPPRARYAETISGLKMTYYTIDTVERERGKPISEILDHAAPGRWP